jgi:uncharacterized protein (DUF1499 family)
MKYAYFALTFIVFIAAALVIAGQLGLLRGKAPELGLRDGKLKPPSKTPNSVSSQADLYPDHVQHGYASIAPIAYVGDAASGMLMLTKALQKQERTVIINQTADYVYAQSTTALLKFTDDVEFVIEPGKNVFHVRSASRLGRQDFGVNRTRVEAIRAAMVGKPL